MSRFSQLVFPPATASWLADVWLRIGSGLPLSLVTVFCCILVFGCGASARHRAPYPRRPIKVVVPFDAGGGSDTFTRIVQRAINEHNLLPQPIVVINVPGAGGTIGARRVKNARPDGYTLLQLHEGLLTSKYSGNAEFGPEAFEPIAGTGRMAHVIAVREDAEFSGIQDLLRAAQRAPNTTIFAVGIGAPSHFAGLMLEGATEGAAFRFTQSGGGAKRYASLLGGHTDVSTFSVSEFIDFRAGGIRALAVLSETRHALLPNVPTAREQGVDVVSGNMHFWWAPKGAPASRTAVLRTALLAAMSTDEVRRQLRDLAIDAISLTGDELTRDLVAREKQVSQVASRSAPTLPNFPLWVLVACVLLGLISVREVAWTGVGLPASTVEVENAATPRRHWVRPLFVFLAMSLYVALMQLGWLDFRIATCIFMAVIGGSLAGWQRGALPLIGGSAVLTSIGLHWLFTNVFIVDLP